MKKQKQTPPAPAIAMREPSNAKSNKSGATNSAAQNTARSGQNSPKMTMPK